jgi:hypothetical protein
MLMLLNVAGHGILLPVGRNDLFTPAFGAYSGTTQDFFHYK